MGIDPGRAASPRGSRRRRRDAISKLFSIMFCSALALQTPLAGVSATLAYADAAQGGASASFTVVEEGADASQGDATDGAGAQGGMTVSEEEAGDSGDTQGDAGDGQATGADVSPLPCYDGCLW